MDATYTIDEECWEYLDPKGVKQGPFSGTRMLLWYESGMLPEDLGVRHSANMPFTPIREMFLAKSLAPFKSRPRPVGMQMPAAKCQALWQYCDTKGQLQGPFTSAQMTQWYEHGMLPKTLQLRRTTDAHFATIGEYFPPPLAPFVSSPLTPAAPRAAKPLMPAQPGYNGLGGGAMPAAATGAALGGISLGSGMAAIAAAAAAANAKAHQAKVAGIPKSTAAVAPKPAGVIPAGAVHPQQQAKQPQAKGKAEAKAKAASKADNGYPVNNGNNVNQAAGEAAGVKGKGKGKNLNNEGPVGAAGSGAAQVSARKGSGKKDKEQHGDGWEWNEQSWNDKAWWEWSSWNGSGWSADGWEGNGKQHGSEWKGKGGDADGPIGASPAKDKAERGNAVQAAFGSLPWGPQAAAVDLMPEDTIRKVQDEGIVWEERWVCPLLVRFSQGKIHPFFHGRGPISEVMLQIRLRAAEADSNVRRIDPPFPPIRLLHLKEQGVLVTLDNRRLYALQRYALQEWPQVCLARALIVDELTPTRLRAENRKFTNRLCGLQLEVESRSNAFDTFSWVTEAAHAEAPKFCRPIAFRAAEKAISLLPMLVVHSLLCPRLCRLLRSRWPLLRFVAELLSNPNRRSFPTKRLLLTHVLELPKPSRRTSTCPPLCIDYKTETVVTLSKGKSCVTSKLSVTKPLKLQQGAPLSDVQRRVLKALLPLFCLPYARSALTGSTRRWVEAFLLAWGKVAAARLQLTL